MRSAAPLCLLLAVTACGGGASLVEADGATAGSEPAGGYLVATDGAGVASQQELDRCLQLPGVTGMPASIAARSRFRVTAVGGEAMRSLEACVGATSGFAAVPVADPDAAFIEQCTGGDDRQHVVPRLIGMTVDAARQAPSSLARRPVRSVRVVAEDGDCLIVTADLRTERADLVVRDGRVIWATVPVASVGE